MKDIRKNRHGLNLTTFIVHGLRALNAYYLNITLVGVNKRSISLKHHGDVRD